MLQLVAICQYPFHFQVLDALLKYILRPPQYGHFAQNVKLVVSQIQFQRKSNFLRSRKIGHVSGIEEVELHFVGRKKKDGKMPRHRGMLFT